MTCGKNMPCSLCRTPRVTPQGEIIILPPDEPPAYEGEGNLTDELRTGHQSHKPHIRLCTGCLQRVMRKK